MNQSHHLIKINAIQLQEALQQLEANLEQQLQLICITSRSPSLPVVTSTSASGAHNSLQEQIPNTTSAGEASPSIQNAAPYVNSNDDEWEWVPVQML